MAVTELQITVTVMAVLLSMLFPQQLLGHAFTFECPDGHSANPVPGDVMIFACPHQGKTAEKLVVI